MSMITHNGISIFKETICIKCGMPFIKECELLRDDLDLCSNCYQEKLSENMIWDEGELRWQNR